MSEFYWCGDEIEKSNIKNLRHIATKRMNTRMYAVIDELKSIFNIPKLGTIVVENSTYVYMPGIISKITAEKFKEHIDQIQKLIVFHDIIGVPIRKTHIKLYRFEDMETVISIVNKIENKHISSNFKCDPIQYRQIMRQLFNGTGDEIRLNAADIIDRICKENYDILRCTILQSIIDAKDICAL
jgi:hypothetical protein